MYVCCTKNRLQRFGLHFSCTLSSFQIPHYIQSIFFVCSSKNGFYSSKPTCFLFWIYIILIKNETFVPFFYHHPTGRQVLVKNPMIGFAVVDGFSGE